MTQLADLKADARVKALDSLARYKFIMFGYWSATWVHLNQLGPIKDPNPFRPLVHTARKLRALNDRQPHLPNG